MARLEFVGLMGLIACKTGETDPSDTDTDTSVETDTAQTIDVVGPSAIWDECGPADGAALMLVLDENRGMPTCDTSWSTVHLVRLYLFANLPTSAPATATIGADYSAGGTATYCPDYTAGSCVDAVSGQVEFTTWTDGAAAAGTFTFELADGTTVAGPFDASWCANSPVCG